MKILSVNVNNFGGKIPKPLPKYYKKSSDDCDWDSYNKDVDHWRDDNKECILKNVVAITDLVKDFDIIFLHEVDTNCESWEKLVEIMSPQYNWKPANGFEPKEYCKGKKSVSCVFYKKNVSIKCDDYNMTDSHRNVEIEIDDIHIVGLHMPYDIEYWDALISRYNTYKNRKFLIIGDLNVYDKGTGRREKFDELIKDGAIDLWLKQGECNDVPTADTGKRIDYALATPALYEMGIYELILNCVRLKGFTDHAAIAVNIMMKKNESKPEYVSNLTDNLGQRHLGEYIPVYDAEADCWCVKTGHGFEYGSLDYVAAEFSGSGLIYHFIENGREDHVHTFEAVLERIFANPERIRLKTEYGEYSEIELQFVQSIRQAVSFVKTHNRPMTNAELRENRESAISLCGEDEEK